MAVGQRSDRSAVLIRSGYCDVPLVRTIRCAMDLTRFVVARLRLQADLGQNRRKQHGEQADDEFNK